MSTGLPTIWALVAGGAATLPEPFSRAALINWIHARRPDVGVTSISTHIQLATANAAHPDDSGRHRHRPPVRVADLFQSAGFARARHHAASSGMPWFVLSDRHGLLEPDDVVAPLRPRAGGLLDARRRRLAEPLR
jgi:hypothetical protein